MRAAAYQRLELASCCICGPRASSMKRAGFAGDSRAKKKSGPRPIQAVPAFRSLASNVVVIASSSAGLADLASAMSCGAVDLSAARLGIEKGRARTAAQQIWIAALWMVVRIVARIVLRVAMRTRVTPLARCIITLNWLGVESVF